MTPFSTVSLRRDGGVRELSDRAEWQRRSIVALCQLFFILLPAEGILRKWMLNQLNQPLALIRDPVSLLIYVIYLSWSRRPARLWPSIWLIVAAAFVVFQLVQGLFVPQPLQVYLIGFRYYVLYAPLAFIMGDTYSRNDLRRWLSLCLAVSIPISALVVLQFFSPVSSPINKGLSDDIQSRFVVIAGIVRPYGPFTFVLAQSTFSSIAVSALVIAYDARKRLGLTGLFLGASALAIFIMGALSGSRTFFVGAGIVVLAYVVGTLLTGSIWLTVRRLGFAIGATALFAAIFIVAFPTSFAAMQQRQAFANQMEGSIALRALRMVTGVGDALGVASPLGAGMGSGSNAANTGVSVTGRYFTLSENDWPRTIEEAGPFVGVLILGLRTALVAYFGAGAVAAARRGSPLALAMFGAAAPILFAAQVTLQNQMLSFCWYACGLTLALARQAESKESEPGVTNGGSRG